MRRIVMAALLLGVLGLALIGCNKQEDVAAAPGVKPPAPGTGAAAPGAGAANKPQAQAASDSDFQANPNYSGPGIGSKSR
jgi:hypothetical protein